MSRRRTTRLKVLVVVLSTGAGCGSSTHGPVDLAPRLGLVPPASDSAERGWTRSRSLAAGAEHRMDVMRRWPGGHLDVVALPVVAVSSDPSVLHSEGQADGRIRVKSYREGSVSISAAQVDPASGRRLTGSTNVEVRAVARAELTPFVVGPVMPLPASTLAAGIVLLESAEVLVVSRALDEGGAELGGFGRSQWETTPEAIVEDASPRWLIDLARIGAGGVAGVLEVQHAGERLFLEVDPTAEVERVALYRFVPGPTQGLVGQVVDPDRTLVLADPGGGFGWELHLAAWDAAGRYIAGDGGEVPLVQLDESRGVASVVALDRCVLGRVTDHLTARSFCVRTFDDTSGTLTVSWRGVVLALEVQLIPEPPRF